jgi:hypothetical protein
MQFSSIIGLSILAAITYGVIHDQITTRICIEYFTVGHARLIDSNSPTILGLFWGVVATWWVGLPLGLGLAIAARSGRRPKLGASDLVPPLLRLMMVMFSVATLAGMIGFFTSKAGVFRLIQPLAGKVPSEHHVAFLTCGWAHSASYLAGLVGGVALWILTWRRRGRILADTHLNP